MDQRQKFMYTANALPYDALMLVSDLVTSPPALQPYTMLKEHLLVSYKLTAVQMAEKVLDLPSLGDRRPSQLLAAMLEYYPEGEADTEFFHASFFRQLPKEIRVLMTNEVNGDLKELAIRADELFQHHRLAVVAAMQGADSCGKDEVLAEAVAALDLKGRKFQKNKQEKTGGTRSGGGSSNNSGGGGKSGGDGGHSYFVFDRHWKYGEKAYRCDVPARCQWQGN